MTKAAPPFRFEQLDKQDRSTFDSGTPVLDNYLKTMASQEMRRGLANCFLAIHKESEAIAGYYTLSASNVVLHDLPKGHNFGRYTSIPAILIGRLAVDRRFQGQGLGRILLVDAMRQMSASTVAAALLVVEAKDDRAATFYRHCGFQTYGTAGNKFLLSLQHVRRILSAAR